MVSLFLEGAGLLIHDLGTPLHVVLFCAKQETLDEKAHKQLERASLKCGDAFDLLRRYLRALRQTEASAPLSDCVYFGQHLMSCRMEEEELRGVEVKLGELEDCYVRIPPRALIGILALLFSEAALLGKKSISIDRVPGTPIRLNIEGLGNFRKPTAEIQWMEAALDRWGAQLTTSPLLGNRGALYSLLLPQADSEEEANP